MTTPVVLETQFPGLTLARRGKVRDVYDLGETLLIVATDRISAFDYVLGSGIPDKGKVLTQLSAFWFERLAELTPNHLLSIDVKDFPAETEPFHDVMRGRSMWVRKTNPLPVECVARGYLSGSGLKDYQKTGAVCGITLPAGLVDSSPLPEPIFTPATKAETGHDENISEAEAGNILGVDLVNELKALTLQIYGEGVAHAATCGIIIADTKFEFGLVPQPDGRQELVLIDEVLTPDSSRFWPKALYAAGRAQPSYDKQFVRDYLEQIKWNKQPPVPSLPDDVVVKTREKYLEAYRCRRAGIWTSDDPERRLMIRDDLDTLVQHLLDRGILFEDAQREFEKMFITRALSKTNYNVCKAAKITGLHRNTLSRKIATYRIKRAG